jgi:hypothetical protein
MTVQNGNDARSDADVADLPSGAGGSATGNPDATPKPIFGGVFIEFVPETHTSFLGTFFDGPSSEQTPLDLRQEQAGCRLMVPRPVACTPNCGLDAVCTGTNVCTPRPNQVDVGELHVEGLGDSTYDVKPTAPNILSYQIITSLAYAACKEGVDVKVSANAFSLATKCISPLKVTSPVPIPVTSGQPMHLAWTPPGQSGISRIEIELEISHHGGFKGQIECDVPDTGSFDVPAPLITALVSLGRAGYPTVKVARTSRASAATQPQVTLTVHSQVELPVNTGVISCGGGDSPPCPTGTTCQFGFTCGPMN